MASPAALAANQKAASAAIDKTLREEAARLKAQQPIQILLLGTERAGKTTILKQFKLLHGVPFAAADRTVFRAAIRRNLVADLIAALNIVQSNETSPVQNPDAQHAAQTLPKLLADCTDVYPLGDAPDATFEQILPLATALAADSGFTNHIAAANSLFDVDDSFAYFLPRVAEVFSSSFSPSDTDILNTRIPTATPSSTDVLDGKQLIRIHDVPGFRAYRNKWAAFFDGCSSIMFVVAANSYSQPVPDDPTKTRLTDALEAFTAVAKNPLFKGIPVIIVINKVDLLEKRLELSPFKAAYNDYSHENTPNDVLAYVSNMFQTVSKENNHNTFTITSTATNSQLMKDTVDRIKFFVLQKAMTAIGLI